MKKTRGRPKGSEKNDDKALNAIADMLHANPALKPTTAMRRHNARIEATEIRRLQGKWMKRKETLLAAARARAGAERNKPVSVGIPVARSSLGAVAGAVRTAQAMYNSPEMRAMREFQNSPTARAIWAAHNSPEMRLMREIHNSPEMRLMREMHNSPTMRAARQIAETHAKLNSMLGGW